jgi:hypothetical protein
MQEKRKILKMIKLWIVLPLPPFVGVGFRKADGEDQ